MQSELGPRYHCVEPAGDMGFSTDIRSSSKQQNKSTLEDSVVHPQASRRTKHTEKVKVRTGVGSAEIDPRYKLRPEGDVGDDSLLAKENLQRPSMKGNAAKVDELVKHMSNLPGYLQHPERGEKPQEKVLNVGVLDWSRLEKWKHMQKHAPEKGSYNSALERTTGAFTSSRIIQPGSRPEQQSSHCSSLKSSRRDVLSQGAKATVLRFQDSESNSKNAIHGQKKITFPYRSFGRNHSEIMIDKGKGKISAQGISSERETVPANLNSSGVSFGQKEEMSSSSGKAKKTNELQESDIKRKDIDDRIITERGSLLSKPRVYDVSLSSKGKAISCNTKTEKSAEELPDVDVTQDDEHCPVEENNNIVLRSSKDCSQIGSPEVLPLSKPKASCDEHLTEANKISFSGDFSTKDMDFAELYSEVPHSCPLPSVQKRLARASFDTSRTLDQEDFELANRKETPPSPNRRFSFSLGKLGRSFSFKESSAIPELGSTHMTIKSGPVRPEPSDCSNNANLEKASSHNKGRSSPLRRLLDPILKHRDPIPKHRDPVLKHKEAIPLHSAEVVKPLKVNSDTSVLRPINVSDSLQNVKREASWVQALLQLTMKNGLPMFKFLVDKSSNCLVATMKNPSEKDELGQNFTFYCVNEIKRKSGGWMSHGSKAKSCGYAYNVVGQMKVTTPDLSDVEGQNLRKYMVRESVLYSVELRQPANPKFILNRELSAAVVKIPGNDLSHVEQSNEQSMEKDCTKCMPEQSSSYSWDDSSIVILPGGVHSTPNKGEPSSLIHRWRSGGSCDCGGWDIGCKLRVLSNKNKCCQIPKASTPMTDHLELFVEGEVQEIRPFFSLTPGKDGTYSVVFNTSLSLLQAFFICVVVITSQKPSDLSEAQLPQESTLNGSSGIQMTGPSKYAPNPPYSPVGRV